MDHVQKQRESIVLYKEKRNSADYIRIKYVTSQAIAMLLTQDTDVEKAGDNSAYILREYHPKKWLFEGETPGEPYSASALVKVLKETAQRADIKHWVHVHTRSHSKIFYLLNISELSTLKNVTANDLETSYILFLSQLCNIQRTL